MSQPKKQPYIVSWSGGKDSLLALERLRAQGETVAGLLTTITEEDRIAMHGVSVELLRLQAEALGLPLVTSPVPAFPTNAIYEAALARAVDRFRSLGIERMAFGDLFLEDIRAYREGLCQRWGLTAVFPLWGLNTTEIAQEFLARGGCATICCARREDWVGQAYDADFIARIATDSDPCGENGEFHTFVTDGPGFHHPVHGSVAGRTRRQGFWQAEWTVEAVQHHTHEDRPRRTLPAAALTQGDCAG